MDLTGKTALVTGSSRNIGAEIAVTLAETGADVGITARSNEAGCLETAKRVENEGRATAVELGDLSEPTEIETIVNSVRNELGPIDILVNNATVRPKKPFLEVTPEDLDQVLAVNVKGMYLTTQQVVPDMIASGGGSVVNLIGALVYLGRSGKTHSYASKMAIEGQVRQLASELGPEGIRVNGLSPGHIETEREGPYEHEERLINAMPLRRKGTVTEVADACCFLASDRSSFITGQVLHVNGGIYPTPNILPVD